MTEILRTIKDVSRITADSVQILYSIIGKDECYMATRFTIPRDVYYGPGAMEELKVLKGHKKAFIVTGTSFMKENGSLTKLEGILRDAGMAVEVFAGVENNPPISTVYRGAEAMRKFQPDVIVTLGGGSPTDAAKAMWIFYENPELKFDDVKTPYSLPKLRRKAIMASIGSTSGTGTEVTSFAVITDDATGIKYPIADFEVTPDIAIVDTDVPQSMDPSLTADTGMDAMTHAIEAYVATAHTPLTDALAIKSAQMIYDSLIDSYNGSEQGKATVHVAQNLAGMAFSNALLGIVHSLAHKVGVTYKLPHGRCNAIMLPYVIQYNRRVCEDRFADIARAFGLTGTTNAQLTNSLIATIQELNKTLHIPASYKDAGVDEGVFKASFNTLTQAAVGDPCTLFNPRETDLDNMQKVLKCCYYGTPVNF